VQFDFPDKNGKPYKTSGGKMVWNNELKREIPAGWESLKLSSKFTFEKGIEPGSAEYTDQKESIYHVNFIRVGDVDGSSAIFIDTRPKSYAMVFERDVLVTFDGSVGKVAFGLQGAYSGGLRKIYDKSGLIDNSLIYFIFMDERLIKTIHKYATGSILLHAGSSIDILKIPYNEKIYLEYQNIIKTSYNKMVINKKENQKLTKLRDWLLPMLMNGQVKVGKD
jgi:type I restriction enzyme S subunit